jgi:hypothetical protein
LDPFWHIKRSRDIDDPLLQIKRPPMGIPKGRPRNSEPFGNIPYVHLKAARWSTVPPHLRDAAQFLIITGTKALLEGDLAGSHCSPTMAVPPLGPLPLNRPL